MNQTSGTFSIEESKDFSGSFMPTIDQRKDKNNKLKMIITEDQSVLSPMTATLTSFSRSPRVICMNQADQGLDAISTAFTAMPSLRATRKH